MSGAEGEGRLNVVHDGPPHWRGPPLPPDSGGGTLPPMEALDRINEKLASHDKRFEKIESSLDGIGKELGNAKFWFVGTALALGVGALSLVYAARQDTTATVGAALTAIQTVLSAQQQNQQPQQPTVIVIPQPAPALAPPSSASPPTGQQ